MKKLYAIERDVVASAFDWQRHLSVIGTGRIGNTDTCEVTNCPGFFRVLYAINFAGRIKKALVRIASGADNNELKLAIFLSHNLWVDRWICIDRDDLVTLALQETEHNLDAEVMDLSFGHLICHELSHEP